MPQLFFIAVQPAADQARTLHALSVRLAAELGLTAPVIAADRLHDARARSAALR